MNAYMRHHDAYRITVEGRTTYATTEPQQAQRYYDEHCARREAGQQQVTLYRNGEAVEQTP